MPEIGLVGAGVIGQLYALNLLKAYKEIDIYDIDEQRARTLEEKGARCMTSAKGLAEDSEMIVMALPSPSAVEAAVTGPEGLLAGAKAGAIILDLSTIDPGTSIRMYDLAKEGGVSYLDAPVSGGAPRGAGTEGARHATITFMVGGDKDAFDRARPVMEVLGKKLFYLGPSGTGSTVKLLSNLISGLNNLIVAEAFVLGAAAGIGPETLLEVFNETDADSYFLREYIAPRIQRRDFDPGFSVDLQYKDLRLTGELAQRLGVPLLFNELALQVYQMMRAQGLGQKDLVEAIRFWGRLSDADIYKPSHTPQAQERP